MKKYILTLSFILLIISCSNNKNNNINNNQTNTNSIETQTNELQQAEELNNDNNSYTQKNIEWISHHYYTKNDEGDFFSVYLNDRWPENNSELTPNYEMVKVAVNYKNLNDIYQFYNKNSIADITNNRIYAEARNGDSIESTYSNITSFKMTSKSLNSSSKEINTASSLKAAVYNYASSDVSETNEYGSASTFSYKDSIFLLIPDNTNKLEVYDKISFDINENFNLNNLKRNENLEFEDKKGSISKLFENAMSDFYNEWLTNSSDSYESIKSINITYFNDKSISITTTSTLYLGGAHGVYNNHNSVYSLETGEKIEITNFIKDFNDTELKDIMRDKLLSIDNRTEEDYLVPLDEITLADTSFYIYADGIHFVWPIYSITAYVLGETEIIFDFDEIKPFIKDEYLYIIE